MVRRPRWTPTLVGPNNSPDDLQSSPAAVNVWIRTSGEYADVIYFNRMLHDPDSPSKMLASRDSGDHGHPNDAGYKALADAIHLRLFRN